MIRFKFDNETYAYDSADELAFCLLRPAEARKEGFSEVPDLADVISDVSVDGFPYDGNLTFEDLLSDLDIDEDYQFESERFDEAMNLMYPNATASEREDILEGRL